MGDWFKVNQTERTRIDQDTLDGPATVTNYGPNTVYYGGSGVSSVSFTGSLAQGASLTIPPGYYFVSAGRSRLFVDDESEDERLVSVESSEVTLAEPNTSDDTSAINTLLAASAGKKVVARPGRTYLISAPLVIPSATELDMSSATVRLKTGSSCNMVQSPGVNAVRRVLDAAITSADATLTSATGAFTSADVGKAITVQGAGASGVPLTTTIASLNSSTSVELTVNAGTTVSGQYAAVGARDNDITVRGGIWDRQNNTDSVNHWNAHSLRFRHVDGLRVIDVTMQGTAGKYLINPGDCTDVAIIRPRFTSHFSDGVHLSGPLARAVIRDTVGDYLGDDLVSLTARDSTSAITDCAGDITDVLIDGARLATVDPAQFASALKIIAGKTTDSSASYAVRRVTARGLTAPCQTAAVAFLGDSSLGTLSEITLDGVHSLGMSSLAFNTVYLRGGSYDNLTFRNIYAHANDICPIALHQVATVGRMVVENAVQPSGGTASKGIVTIDGSIASLMLTRCTQKGNTGSSFAHVTNGLGGTKPTLSRVTVSDSHLEVATGGSGATPVRSEDSGSTLGTIELSNIMVANANYALCFVNSTVTVLARNVRAEGASMGDWLRVNGSAVVTMHADGLQGTITSTNIQAGGSLRSKTLGLPIDVGTTGLAKNAGDMAYNTNAARSCGLGPVVSDGTNWKGLFSGATF